MVITTGTGEVYQDKFDMLSKPFRPAEEGSGDLSSGQKEGQKFDIDREHHVPLLASAIMGEDGDMTGLAIDHRVNVPSEYLPHLALHEATELPLMQSYIESDGMKPGEAYAKAHAIATAVESGSVRRAASRAGLDPDQYHDQYKQFFRDAASTTSLPSDRPRHPDAHTTRYALDEHELGHKPLQMDVLGAGVGMHSGPGQPTKMEASEFPNIKPLMESVGKIHEMAGGARIKRKVSDPANENIEGMGKPSETPKQHPFERIQEIEKTNPDLYKYKRALDQQQGKDQEGWKNYDEWKQLGELQEELKSLLTKPADESSKAIVNPPYENKGEGALWALSPPTMKRSVNITRQHPERLEGRKTQLRDYAKERANPTLKAYDEFHKKDKE